ADSPPPSRSPSKRDRLPRGLHRAAEPPWVERCQQRTATTVPVAACPGLAAYPGSVWTITTCGVSSVIVEPDCEIELETSTAMKLGRGPVGGFELLPGPVDQLAPHAGSMLGLFSKPLNAAGADPPFSVFFFDHCDPQNVTFVETAALPSPITKWPPAEVPKIRIVVVASAVLPPSSTMWILIVKKPNDVYVWLPLTVYGPLPLPATVPLVAAVASPQSIVAVKSAVVAN